MKLYKNVGHYQAETDLKYFDNRAYNDVKAFDGQLGRCMSMSCAFSREKKSAL